MVSVGGKRKRSVAGGDQQTKKIKVKETNQASLLSVDNSHTPDPKEVVEAKDRWVTVKVTMDSGAANRVMPETMFPLDKVERNTSPQKFVATNGEQIKDLGERENLFKTNEGIQRSITLRTANAVKPLTSMQKVARTGPLGSAPSAKRPSVPVHRKRLNTLSRCNGPNPHHVVTQVSFGFLQKRNTPRVGLNCRLN